MTSSLARVSFLILGLSSACKTVNEKPAPIQAAAPAPAAVKEPEAPKPVPPSAALKSTPDLVTPGPDEVLNRRGPGAACPELADLKTVKQAVESLGNETMALVKEDLVSLKQTADRKEVESCCNQMEQLVQDVEIMNEDKETAALEQIRQLTRRLCPPSQ